MIFIALVAGRLPAAQQAAAGRKPMSNNQATQRSEADAALEREIREGRKFTRAD
jgi:hypothetical protein